MAGQNAALHLAISEVRSPAALSKMTGIPVRCFKHAISNQLVSKLLKDHPDITTAHYLALPALLRTGQIRLAAKGGANGIPRVIYRGRIAGRLYEYVGEVRAGKRRIDGVTFYQVT